MACEHTKRWYCQARGHENQVFNRKVDLEDHIRQSHIHDIAEDQVEPLVEASAKPASELFAILVVALGAYEEPTRGSVPACPFCEEFSAQNHPPGNGSPEVYSNGFDKLISEHIARHLESISLLSLPGREDIALSDSPWASEEPVNRLSDDEPAVSRTEDLSLSFEDNGTSSAESLYDDTPLLCQDWDFIFNAPGGRLSIFPSAEEDDLLRKFLETSIKW